MIVVQFQQSKALLADGLNVQPSAALPFDASDASNCADRVRHGGAAHFAPRVNQNHPEGLARVEALANHLEIARLKYLER
jgi:hypothetical protein